MSDDQITDLSKSERRFLLEELHQAIRETYPELLEKLECQDQGGLADLDAHLDELVSIVRSTTATRIESYLAQILDQICTKCPHQEPSAFCPLRHEGKCLLYTCAGAAVAGLRRGLREIEIERGLLRHSASPAVCPTLSNQGA